MSTTRKRYGCPVEVTVEAIGGKWKSSILWWLRRHAKRPSELMQLIPGISQKVLTTQLRELEADDLIYRQAYRETPPRVEYALTPQGQTLQPLVELMAEWGKQKLPEFEFGIVSLKGVRVLIIANEPTVHSLRMQLGVVCQATITVASRAILLEQTQLVQPDVVLVDFEADEDDFTLLIQHLQQLEMELNRPIPAIALTNPNARIRAFSQGFRVVFSKPVEAVELAAATASLTGRLG